MRSGTIQAALYKAISLFNRHYRDKWHYLTGTIENNGTIQPALLGACHCVDRDAHPGPSLSFPGLEQTPTEPYLHMLCIADSEYESPPNYAPTFAGGGTDQTRCTDTRSVARQPDLNPDSNLDGVSRKRDKKKIGTENKQSHHHHHRQHSPR